MGEPRIQCHLTVVIPNSSLRPATKERQNHLQAWNAEGERLGCESGRKFLDSSDSILYCLEKQQGKSFPH